MPKSLRRCVVCRCSSSPAELQRCTIKNGQLVLDGLRKEPGRGAYVHLQLRCLSKMAEPKAWEYALGLPRGSIKLEPLRIEAQRLSLRAAQKIS